MNTPLTHDPQPTSKEGKYSEEESSKRMESEGGGSDKSGFEKPQADQRKYGYAEPKPSAGNIGEKILTANKALIEKMDAEEAEQVGN